MLAFSTVARNSRSLGLFRKTAISCSARRQAHVRVLSARRDSSHHLGKVLANFPVLGSTLIPDFS